MANIETLLYVEIENRFNELDGMKAGSPEYEKTVDGVAKLMDRAIELERLDQETQDKAETQKEEKKDRLLRNIIAAASIIIPTLVTVWGTKKSFEFEKEGTITTIMGRGFIQKLLPKK